jgi:hypothetical protein
LCWPVTMQPNRTNAARLWSRWPIDCFQVVTETVGAVF